MGLSDVKTWWSGSRRRRPAISSQRPVGDPQRAGADCAYVAVDEGKALVDGFLDGGEDPNDAGKARRMDFGESSAPRRTPDATILRPLVAKDGREEGNRYAVTPPTRRHGRGSSRWSRCSGGRGRPQRESERRPLPFDPSPRTGSTMCGALKKGRGWEDRQLFSGAAGAGDDEGAAEGAVTPAAARRRAQLPRWAPWRPAPPRRRRP
jgi:hypothetical protein